MAEKPGYNVASGFNGGVTVGINADTWEQFVYLCEQVWPGRGQAAAQGLYGNLLSQSGLAMAVTEAQAVDVLQQQLGAQPVPQPLPAYLQGQPAYQQQPPTYQQAPPVQAQNGPPPGQTCDPRDSTKNKWVPPGHSNKTGKDYPGFWARP